MKRSTKLQLAIAEQLIGFTDEVAQICSKEAVELGRLTPPGSVKAIPFPAELKAVK
jgi:hypothetical protein